MRILFIQDFPMESFGIMHTSSLLKQDNHHCDVLIETNVNRIITYMKHRYFDIIAFYAMDFLSYYSAFFEKYHWVLKVSKEIKKNFNCKILVNGPITSFYPEIINNQQIDFICIGENEYAIKEMLDNLDENKKINKIKNLWVRENNKVYKNEVRPLIKNLDDLPFPDRELYYSKYNYLKNWSLKRFLSGRGCPFVCSFCHNSVLKNIYRNKEDHIRKKSPEKFTEEILLVKDRWKMKTVGFSDDIFTLNRGWLNKFLDLYKKEINIPFVCNTHPNTINEKELVSLKKAGCYGLMIGIETGNERLRNNILNKKISNTQIIKISKLIKKYNMKLMTFNISGLPGESIDNAFETIKLNIKIKTNYCYCSLLQYFPQTKISEYMINKSNQKNKFTGNNTFNYQNFYFKSKYENQLSNLSQLFYIAVKNPKLMPLIKSIIKLPNNGLFNTIGLFDYGYNIMKFFRINKLSILIFFYLVTTLRHNRIKSYAVSVKK